MLPDKKLHASGEDYLSKFTQNLYYNNGNGTAKYNGSISSMTWKAGNESTIRGYKFTYDGFSRLFNPTTPPPKLFFWEAISKVTLPVA